MIHYLKIKNFGPVSEEVELSFEAALENEFSDDFYSVVMADGTRLLKLAYIYGANASGKTTILNAFEFIRNILLKPLPDKASMLDFQPFLFCEDPEKAHSELELAFYAEGLRYVYQATFSTEAIISEKLVFFQTAKPTELFSRETNMESRVAEVKFGTRLRVPARERERLETNTLHNNTVLGAFTKTNADIPELNVINLWLSSFLLGMVTVHTDLVSSTADLIAGDPKANQWLNLFLNKADRQIGEVKADEEKTFSRKKGQEIWPIVNYDHLAAWPVTVNSLRHKGGLDSGSFNRKVNFIHRIGKNDYTLPIESESNGTQRYFALGGPLYTLVHQPSILLIDELEASLHPDLMKHFLQTFLANAGASQMLITTHNIGMMEETDFIRRDALWFSEKKEDGSVDLYSAADFDTGKLRKSGSLVNAYRAGKLGAKPNLGSPYINEPQ